MRLSASLLLGVLLLASCTDGNDVAPAPGITGPPPAAPVAGGTLRVVLAGDVDALDPHQAARPSSWWFARALHRGLYAFPAVAGSDGGRPVPDLAESMPEVSEDGRILTIRLRAGVGFGPPASRAVRAADVTASIRRLIAAGVGIAPFLRDERGSLLRGIDELDEQTIRLRLRRAVPELPWLLAHPQAAIVPARTETPSRPSAIAGTGPYIVVRHRAERSIELARNPGWARELDPIRGAWVDRIEATIGDPAGAREAFLAGEADLVLDPGPPDVAPAIGEDAPRRVEVSPGCVRYLFLDREAAPFDVGRVRLAIAHATDRSAVAAVSGGVPAGRLLPPGITGHLDPRTPAVLPHDPARARELLRAAGLPDGLSTTLVVGDTERDRAEAAALRVAFADAGVRVTVRTVPPAELLALRHEQPRSGIPMGISTWCADWPGLAGRGMLIPLVDPASLGRSAVPARPQVATPEVLDAVRTAGVASPEAAAAAWSRADEAATRAAVLIPLVWPVEEVAVAPRLRGWVSTPMLPRGDPTSVWVEA